MPMHLTHKPSHCSTLYQFHHILGSVISSYHDF